MVISGGQHLSQWTREGLWVKCLAQGNTSDSISPEQEPPRLPPTPWKTLSCCCPSMIYCPGSCSAPVTACEWLLYLFNWRSKWYDHNRCTSWIKGLKPPSWLMCSTGARVPLSSGYSAWRHHIETHMERSRPLMLPSQLSATSFLPDAGLHLSLTWTSPNTPALSELSLWTQWPHPINSPREEGEKKQHVSEIAAQHIKAELLHPLVQIRKA